MPFLGHVEFIILALTDMIRILDLLELSIEFWTCTEFGHC